MIISIRALAPAAGAALLTLSIAACSASSTPSPAPTPSAAPTPSPGHLTVTGAWARPPIGESGTMAVYFTVANPTGVADALVGAATPIAASAALHETMEMGTPAPSAAGAATAMPSGMPMASPGEMAGGMTGMQPVDRVVVPAGGGVSFAPGGYHVMLEGVTSAPAEGSTFPLTLSFEKAGPVAVTVEVQNR